MTNLRLNEYEQYKWLYNVQVFLAPLATLYLVFVIGNFTGAEGAFSFSHFVPNTYVQGGMMLYVLNFLLDYFRKLRK